MGDDKRHVAARADGELRKLSYYSDRPNDPTDLDEVLLDWEPKLGIRHGQSASFLRTGRLYRKPDPPLPTGLPTDTLSLEYKAAEKKYLEKVSLVEKDNAHCEREDAMIFSTIIAALKPSARAQAQKHASWNSVTMKAEDPLALVNILKENLVSVGKAGGAKARQDVMRSIGTITQTKYQSLDDFHRKYAAMIERSILLGAAARPDEDIAAEFLEKLSTRYSELRRYILNGVLPAPKTLQDAYETAGNFVIAVPGQQAQMASSAYASSTAGNRKGNRKDRPKDRSRSPVTAAKHESKKERQEKSEPSPEQKKRDQAAKAKRTVCYICGQKGHLFRFCPDRKRVEGEDEEANDAEEERDDEESGDEESNVFCICVGGDTRGTPVEEALAAREALVKDFADTEIGLDTMCSRHVFGNTALLTNLRKCTPKKFKGVGGFKTATMIGNYGDIGTVYFIPGVPNLLSFHQLADRDDVLIEYASRDKGFHVTIGEDYLFFKARIGRRVYTYDMGEDQEYTRECRQSAFSAVETVEGNEALYTKQQILGAKRAVAFTAAMGFSSMANTLALVQNGRVDAIDFTVDDVARAREIYGENVEAVRGKTTRHKRSKGKYEGRPHGKVIDSDVTMHLDIMFLSGVAFLISYTRPLMMLMATWVKSKKTSDVSAAIAGQKNKLTGAGFKVVGMTADGEGAVGALESTLRSQGVDVNIHGTQTFSAEIDVKTKQIKNCVRSILSLPYMFPLFLLCWAVYFAVSKINMLPTVTNAHSFSPFELFTGRSISLARDLGARRGGPPLGFGSYCEVFEKTTNTVQDRTRPALWMGSVGNAFGTGVFFLLDKQTVVKRDQWKSMPISASIVKKMNDICKSGGGSLPKNPSLYVSNREILDSEENNEDIWDLAPPRTRVVSDSGADLEGWTDSIVETGDAPRAELMRAGSAPLGEDEPEESYAPAAETIDEDERGGYEEEGAHDQGVQQAEEHPSPGSERWSHADPVERAPGSRRDVPDTPWFQQGAPIVEPESGRAKRATRPVVRYGYAAMWTEHEKTPQCSAFTTEKGIPLPFRPSKSGVHRVQHARAEVSRARHHSAYNITVVRALKKFGKEATSSMLKEMTSMRDKGAFRQVRLSSLTAKQLKKVIRSKMFLKEKYLSTGEFEKLKARFVAGGHLQDRSLYSEGETSSPTVSLQSIYLISSIAAREKRKVITLDIGTAYLNADIEKEVLMRVEPKLADILHEIDPANFCPEPDGSMVVQLVKALYGCVESARLWFNTLSGVLTKLGFVANGKDPCVFNLDREGKQLTVTVYVDDLLCTSEKDCNLEWLVQALTSEFKTVTVNRGVIHSYLGQTFDFSVPESVSISMDGYILDIISLYDVKGERATPAKEDLFTVDDTSVSLLAAKAESFHSRVMKLMYLAQRARPDILTAVNFLSTRVTKCTEQDWEKLERVLMYLHATTDIKLHLRCSDAFQVLAYVDSSFAVHPEMKSQSGLVISLGQGTICAASKKQKLVSKSSTEAELIGVSDMLPQVIWTRDFLMGQGYEVKPFLLQDNQSTMALIEKGRSTSARTRHIAIRYFFVKDRVDAGELQIVYEPTETMVADCMTKPLQGHLFKEMRDWLMGGKALTPRGVLEV